MMETHTASDETAGSENNIKKTFQDQDIQNRSVGNVRVM
jgi:hypothetical protein